MNTLPLITVARKRITVPIPNLVFRCFSSSANNPSMNQERVTIQHLPNGIHHVQLNRPDKLNALDMDMFRALADAARQLKKDKSVRAIIMSGKGKAFCTGLDVKSIVSPWSTDESSQSKSYKFTSPTAKMDELLERPSRSRREYQGQDENDNEGNETQETVQDLYKRVSAIGNLAQDIAYLWRDIPVPVIAVLNGMCLGGGLQLALGADLRYATQDCKLSVMEAKWGLIPDMSASITMRELVRIDVAKELTFTGRIVDGVEAERLGLVTRCCENPMEEAVKWAEMIVSRSPDSIAAAKMLYQRTWVSSEKECLETETQIQERLLKSWNQIAASAKNFGINAPYKERQDFDD